MTTALIFAPLVVAVVMLWFDVDRSLIALAYVAVMIVSYLAVWLL